MAKLTLLICLFLCHIIDSICQYCPWEVDEHSVLPCLRGEDLISLLRSLSVVALSSLQIR